MSNGEVCITTVQISKGGAKEIYVGTSIQIGCTTTIVVAIVCEDYVR